MAAAGEALHGAASNPASDAENADPAEAGSLRKMFVQGTEAIETKRCARLGSPGGLGQALQARRMPCTAAQPAPRPWRPAAAAFEPPPPPLVPAALHTLPRCPGAAAGPTTCSRAWSSAR